MFVENLNRIVRKTNVTSRQFPYCTTDSIPIDLMFQENFPTHTQVWNCLSHVNTNMYLIHFYSKNNIKMHIPKSGVLKFQNHIEHSLFITTQRN